MKSDRSEVTQELDVEHATKNITLVPYNKANKSQTSG